MFLKRRASRRKCLDRLGPARSGYEASASARSSSQFPGRSPAYCKSPAGVARWFPRSSPRERSKKSSESASRLRFWSSSSPDVVANVAHSCGRARGGRAATNPIDAPRCAPINAAAPRGRAARPSGAAVGRRSAPLANAAAILRVSARPPRRRVPQIKADGQRDARGMDTLASRGRQAFL